MSKKLLFSTCLAIGVSAGQAMAADCTAPEKPSMPDGATATMEAMLAGQKAVKAFQAENMDYMKCLEDAFNAAKSDAKDESDTAKRALAETDYRNSVEAYNAAVSAEEEIAGAFNVELRAYKAANAN